MKYLDALGFSKYNRAILIVCMRKFILQKEVNGSGQEVYKIRQFNLSTGQQEIAPSIKEQRDLYSSEHWRPLE
jgi:hypothetical protein